MPAYLKIDSPLSTETSADFDKACLQSIEGLKRHPIWQAMTANQERFLEEYILADGDARKAAYKTFPHVTEDKYADALARRFLKGSYVKKMLSLYYGYNLDGLPMTRSELAVLIASRLRSKKVGDMAFAKLADSLITIKGWDRFYTGRGRPRLTPDPVEEQPETPEVQERKNIDELVLKLEKEERENQYGRHFNPRRKKARASKEGRDCGHGQEGRLQGSQGTPPQASGDRTGNEDSSGAAPGSPALEGR